MNEILTSEEICDFKEGDEKIFRKVFVHYYQGLKLFIEKLTDSREEAEDISLMAFQELFNRCKSFERECNMKAFLYICGRNSALNYIKLRQHKKERLKDFISGIISEGIYDIDSIINEKLLAAIYKYIEELPEECKKVFKMLFYEELTPAEIAEMLGITVSTVYNQKSRALAALRSKLFDHYTSFGKKS